MERRAQLVLRGNLLLGFQEQMFSLQVPEVFEKPEVRALMARAGRELAMEDPRGRVPLLPDVKAGSWADFETRMGLTEVPLDTKLPPNGTDLLIPFRGPDGRERLYLTTGTCQPGNITNYMFRATMEHAPDRRKLQQDPRALDRAYADPWNERIGRFLGGLKRRILG